MLALPSALQRIHQQQEEFHLSAVWLMFQQKLYQHACQQILGASKPTSIKSGCLSTMSNTFWKSWSLHGGHELTWSHSYCVLAFSVDGSKICKQHRWAAWLLRVVYRIVRLSDCKGLLELTLSQDSTGERYELKLPHPHQRVHALYAHVCCVVLGESTRTPAIAQIPGYTSLQSLVITGLLCCLGTNKTRRNTLTYCAA